jgi:hypothetical protein
MTLAKGSLSEDLAMIINYNRNNSFIVLATVITIVNYDRKTFIVQATGVDHKKSLRSISKEMLL